MSSSSKETDASLQGKEMSIMSYSFSSHSLNFQFYQFSVIQVVLVSHKVKFLVQDDHDQQFYSLSKGWKFLKFIFNLKWIALLNHYCKGKYAFCGSSDLLTQMLEEKRFILITVYLGLLLQSFLTCCFIWFFWHLKNVTTDVRGSIQKQNYKHFMFV